MKVKITVIDNDTNLEETSVIDTDSINNMKVAHGVSLPYEVVELLVEAVERKKQFNNK